MKIRDACNILNGFAFKSENYTNSGIRIIRIANVQKGFIEDTMPVFYPLNSEGLDKYMLEEGDLLISLTGNVGRVALLEKELLPAALNQRVACLRLKTDKISKRYLFHILNSNYFEQQCMQSSKGVAQKNMSTEWLKDYGIPLYSVERQAEIISVLDRTELIIAYRKKELQKLDELIKARFIEMFGAYTEKARLSDVATISGGLTKSTKRNKLPLRIPYLRVANVSFASIDVSEMLDIGLTEEEYSKTLLQSGDLLFVEGNGSPDQIGRVAIWENQVVPCVHQNHLIKSRFKKGLVIPSFAMYYFMSSKGREQIKRKAVSTSGLYTLSVSKIADLMLPAPPLDLQNQFAAFVAQIDKSKVAIQKSLEKTQLLFDSLMQKYFG